MNIFEIFCAGDGRINEANMSSALHFLLDPSSPLGLGRSALTELLAPIASPVVGLCVPRRGANQDPVDELRQLVTSFERIELKLEETVFNPVKSGAANLREVDLTIRCFGGEDTPRLDEAGDDAPSLVIALENKIFPGSAQGEGKARQLADEYAFLHAKLQEEYAPSEATEVRIPIVFIYLTPGELTDPMLQQWSALELPQEPGEGRDFKAHYTWKAGLAPAPGAAIADIARALLAKEQEGAINPASSHASLFLRSLIKFINNDFGLERNARLWLKPANNARELVTPEMFWKKWAETRKGSHAFARALFECFQAEFARVQAGRGDAVEVAPTLSRIGFFRGGDRPVAIMLQSPTTNRRVEVQVKQGADARLLEALRGFKEQHRVDYEASGPNVNLQIPVDIDPSQLQRLVHLLVAQLP